MPSIPATSTAGNAQRLLPLLPATIDGAQVNAVNARDLHRFLKNGDTFSHWISDRIKQFDFVEHLDFEVLGEIPLNLTSTASAGGRPSKEYALTLDMAKELAMVERNAKGKQARAYFIECEHRALAAPQAAPAGNLVSLALRQTLDVLDWHESRLVAVEERLKAVESTAKRPSAPIVKPSAKAPTKRCVHYKIAGAPVSVAELAVNFRLGRNQTFGWLRGLGHLDKSNLPCAKAVSRGWFTAVMDDHSMLRTRVTIEGQAYLLRRLRLRGLRLGA